MRFTPFLSLLVAIVCATAIGSAQTKTLTLDQARQIALERNVNIAQAQNNVEAAQAGVLAATGSYLPTLSASGGWNWNQNEGPINLGGGVVIPNSRNVRRYFNTGLNLNYTIFDGFSREGGYTRASANAISSEQTSTRTRQSIIFQVESSYLNVLRNEQLVRVSEENLKRDRRQLERIQESNRVGALSKADVYRQQSQVAVDELNLINAQNNFNKSKADLIALIGLNVSDEYAIADPAISTEIAQSELDASIAQTKNFGELIRQAIEKRPDYLAAKEGVRSADGGVSSARSGYFPTVSTSAGYGLSNEEFSKLTENKGINWGINFRWNIFDGFGTNQVLQSAQVLKKNAELAVRSPV